MTSLNFASKSVELEHSSHKDEKGILDRLEKVDKMISAELVKE
jgi:hypothetical protein